MKTKKAKKNEEMLPAPPVMQFDDASRLLQHVVAGVGKGLDELKNDMGEDNARLVDGVERAIKELQNASRLLAEMTSSFRSELSHMDAQYNAYEELRKRIEKSMLDATAAWKTKEEDIKHRLDEVRAEEARLKGLLERASP